MTRPSFVAIASLLSTLLLLSIPSTTCDNHSVHEAFLQCLSNHSHPSYPISTVLYTPDNSSFPSVLQEYIRNLRFNESTTPKPLLIITPVHVSQIQASILCAKTYGLQMKTRSGGHDYEGVSYWSEHPDFFILDMFNFRSVNVSIADDTAWVETGAMLGEVYYAIANQSNNTRGYPAGVCPTVGIGGHISGGGYGNMMRKYGLTVDNVIDAKIIDVKGRVLVRDAMGEDLFWAITGGGGVSFGVVLAYQIKIVPVPLVVTVFTVERTYEQNATDIVHRWTQVADKLDNDIFIRMVIDVVNSTTKPGTKTIRASFVSLFLGDSSRLHSLMSKSFPELGLQQSDCMEMNWAESVLYWTDFPTGTPVDMLLSRVPQVLTHLKRKSDYLQEPIPKKGLEFIFKKMIELETPVLRFNPYGGRMAEISPYATPFPHRAGNIAKIQYATNWVEDGADAANHYLNLTRMLYGYMTPFVSKFPRQAFFNYRDLDIGINHNGPKSYLEGAVYGVKYFLGNYNRLVKVKTEVDPDNLFRNEQSIPVHLTQKINKMHSCTSIMEEMMRLGYVY